MKYLTTNEIAKLWNISERSIRNYCNKGRIPGAILSGKTWLIPKSAKKPDRKVRKIIKPLTLLDSLINEKESRIKNGIYHKLQVEMTYNSNHIEGSKLTHDQTKYIFETKTIGVSNIAINVDDIIETINHFHCIDLVIDNAKHKLNESFIKQLHFSLKNGTEDSRKTWFKIGDYKLYNNEVGGEPTTPPDKVRVELKKIIENYNSKLVISLEDIIDFHYNFEKIHPFQDGNGRIGRLIILKECLRNNIIPFIITDQLKLFYYRGLKEYKNDKAFLLDTCLYSQDLFKKNLDYFDIKY